MLPARRKNKSRKGIFRRYDGGKVKRSRVMQKILGLALPSADSHFFAERVTTSSFYNIKKSLTCEYRVVVYAYTKDSLP